MSSERPASFGAWVKHCRNQRNLTQKEFAAAIGYDVETLRKAERDRYVSRAFVERIAEYEGIALAELAVYPPIAELLGSTALQTSIGETQPAPTLGATEPAAQAALDTTQKQKGAIGVRKRWPWLAASVVLLALALWLLRLFLGSQVAQGEPIPPATVEAVLPSPTAIALPTATPQPTNTLLPTATSTHTPVPPTATLTLAPTSTPEPTATPEPTPVPPPTATPTTTPLPPLRDVAIVFTGNDDIRTLLPEFTTGERVFNGVRFSIPETANKLSSECEENSDWPLDLIIPLGEGVARPETVYILLNAGFTTDQQGIGIGTIELTFADRASPASYQLVLGQNIREWLLNHGPSTIGSPELQEVYRGDSNYEVPGVIDMLSVPIPAEYRDAVLEGLTIRDISRTAFNTRDPCLFTVGVTVRARS